MISDLLDTLCLRSCDINLIYFQVSKVASSTESYIKVTNSNRPGYNIFGNFVSIYINKLRQIVYMGLVH
jgi:hypothetical protein